MKYVTAPAECGKTSAPLHAFLRSFLRSLVQEQKVRERFDYYVYISFANNNAREYKLYPPFPSSGDTASEQGADFILQCATDAILHPSKQGVRYIPIDQTPNLQKSLNGLRQLFAKFKGRVLVHLDEHTHICDRSDREAAEAFTRGAMNVLAQTPGVTVLVTDANVPPLPPKGASTCPRECVNVPTLDIDAAMAAVPELARFLQRIKTIKLEGKQQRLWAVLRFRLAFKLRTLSLSKVQVRDEAVKRFLAQFAAEAAKPSIEDALTGCCLVSASQFNPPSLNERAAQLLVGPIEYYTEELHQVDYVCV